MTSAIEAGAHQPIILGEKIAIRTPPERRFLRSGEGGYQRQGGGSAYLEVPVQDIEALGFPEEFGRVPQNSQAKTRLVLRSRGSLRVAELTFFPKDFETDSSTWRIQMSNGDEPTLSTRGKNLPPKIDFKPHLSDFFSGLIDISRPWRRTLEDYQDAVREWSKGWSLQDIEETLEAARIAHEQLGTIRRRSREPQTEHAYETARILVEEMGILDPVVIKGAWLHDVPEDGQGYRQFNLEDEDPPESITPHSLWEEGVIAKFTPRVGYEAAELATSVSRPKAEGIEIPNREKGYKKYYSRFPEDVRRILVKIADRLHNLRTLWAMPLASQRSTIIETKTIYWPIFELARALYPEAVDYALAQQDKEMRVLVASNPKLKINYDLL